ncbi:MAG TPA: NAD(P)/FAD-dependent oxidoreductase [Microbacterium sp.]|nr:NAD(P)/FAD-dependent oxidoreductase [Microbacterium sp.]
MEAHDVIVIGAGLAGLNCASLLAEAGRDVVVLEAEPVVGGRERTDVLDGFLLDRGFQVLNPAYPAVKRRLDVGELGLRPFPVGVTVRRHDGVKRLSHPLRRPRDVPGTLASGVLRPRDAAALARWVIPVLLRPRAVIAAPDRTLAEGWDRVGLRGPLRTEVLEPFLAGVLADDRGESSDAFARLLTRMFVLGAPGVPERGIAAVPAQLAGRARQAGAVIRTGMRVQAIGRRAGAMRVDMAGGDPLGARSVVVAVGPDRVADLLDLERPRTRGLQTWWFAADVAPTASALLAVDGRRAGPVVNTVVMSHSAPSYAPPGRHLVAATCLLPASARADPASAPHEADVRRQVGEIWGAGTSDWRLLRRDDIHDALPAQTPPLRVRQPVRHAEGLYVAGDHRDTASIQGALVSGERAARAVLDDLDG